LLVILLVVDGPYYTAAPVTFHVVFAADGIRVVPGAAARPDVTLTTDRATATRLARGEANAQQALAAGRYRVMGDIEGLTRRAAALRALDDVFVTVRAQTSYR
jgi:putative sterol carrier protein